MQVFVLLALHGILNDLHTCYIGLGRMALARNTPTSGREDVQGPVPKKGPKDVASPEGGSIKPSTAGNQEIYRMFFFQNHSIAKSGSLLFLIEVQEYSNGPLPRGQFLLRCASQRTVVDGEIVCCCLGSASC